MDIDKATETVEKADGVLTAIAKLLKKHWKTILLLVFIVFAYWFFGMVQKEIDAEDERSLHQQHGHHDEPINQQKN